MRPQVPEDFVRAPKAGSSNASTPDFDKSVGSQLWCRGESSVSTLSLFGRAYEYSCIQKPFLVQDVSGSSYFRAW